MPRHLASLEAVASPDSLGRRRSRLTSTPPDRTPPATTTTEHPTDAAFAALLEGRLSAPDTARLQEHLAACSTCGAIAAGLTRDDSEPGHALAAVLGATLGRGASIGRFLVLSLIGQGGMGEVYAAYDPELDRRVALKLLRTAQGPESARRRLVREARALGKLSHPNVVQVYDVGEHEGDVFVAMELVEGQSFDAWCRGTPRPAWRDVLAAYLDAARGLAAAHEKGLVHRDVKPSNLLRGADGRVRVVDFGLAAVSEDPANEEADAEHTALPEHPGEARLTSTGAILGTPLYMAPEQHEGGRASAASDQYSLCTALYEGLYGALPFATGPGADLAEVLARKRSGALGPPPAGAPVPAWIHAALARGLATRPEDRHPSIPALVAALGSDPDARRRARLRRVGIGLASAALLAVAAAGWVRSGAFEDPCAHPDRQLAGVWDAGVAARVRAAFTGTGRPYAEDTAARVTALLDRYGASWSSMRGEVCEASRSPEQRIGILALREACLDQRRGQLAALAKVLAEHPDPGVVDKAVTAASSLPSIAYCADTTALAARVPPPEDAALRARVAALQPKVDEVDALRSAGKYKEALALGEPLLAEADGTAYAPLRAQVQVLVGKLRENDGNYAGAAEILGAGASTAADGKDDLLAADAMAALLRTVGQDQKRFPEASVLMTIGRAVVSRAADPAAWARWSNVEGLALYTMGRLAEARDAFDRALAFSEKSLGPDSPEFVRVLANRAGALEEMNDLAPAKADYERALSVLSAALGPEHPDVAATRYNLAMVLAKMGDFAGAVHMYEHALASRESALGPDHPLVASTLTNLAWVLRKMGADGRAKPLLQRALAIKEKTLAADHPAIAVTACNLAAVDYDLDDFPDARRLFERAVGIWERAKSPNVTYGLVGLGRTLVHLGETDAASQQLERALTQWEKAKGKSDPILAGPLLGLGEVALARRRPADAVPLLERALSLHDAESEPEIQLTLADALWATATDRPRAIDLAERARAAYEHLGHPTGLDRATRWLAEHPRDRRDVTPPSSAPAPGSDRSGSASHG